MTNSMHTRLALYQWAAGLCDFGTGILLVVAPALTMRLMFLHAASSSIAFVQFIGVFVGCVGFSYLWAALAWPLANDNASRWEAQWWITASIRSAVATFLLVQVMRGSMETAWLIVAVSDAAFAAVQWSGLRRRWFDAR